MNNVFIDPTTVILFDDITDTSIRGALESLIELEQIGHKTANLIINTSGGLVDATTTLLDYLDSTSLTVTAIGSGAVMSAGFNIFCCCPIRKAFKHTMFMSHVVSASAYGKVNDLAVSAVTTQKVAEDVTFRVAKKLKIPLAKCKKQFYNLTDTYFTTQELHALGVVQEILGDKK